MYWGTSAQFCSQYIDLVIFQTNSLCIGDSLVSVGSVIFSSIYLVVSYVDNHVCESYMCKSDAHYFFFSFKNIF